MNVTLSADEKLVKKARDYAARHETSLNRMIREFMQKITGLADLERKADEFARLARQGGGAAPKGFVFDREEAHNRKA